MANPFTIGSRPFGSQKEAIKFFDEIRKEYYDSHTEIRPPSENFALLNELFTRYCQYEPGQNKEYWPLPGKISFFYVKSKTVAGGTNPCFWVKFDSGNDRDFSAPKAIAVIAKKG